MSINLSSPIRLLLVFALILGLFFAFFHPVFVKPPRGDVPFIPPASLEYAELDSPDISGLEGATFQPYQPAPLVREPGYHAARATFELTEIPASGLAILGLSGGDNVIHFVNGVQVDGRGSMRVEDPAFRGNLRSIGRVPASGLRVGENQVTSVSVLQTPRTLLVAPPMLADYALASEQFAWREFLQTEFHIIATVATLVLALLIGGAALRSRDRALASWLFALVASWGLFSLFPIWVSNPVGGVARVWSYFAAYMLFSMAWPAFVDAWSRHPVRHFRSAMVALFGAALLGGTVLAIAAPRVFLVDVMIEAMNWAGLASIALTAGRLVYHFATQRGEDRVWEGAIMLLILFLNGWHIYDFVVEGRNDFMLERAQPFLLVALGIAFFAGRFHLFRSADDINRVLRERLDVREAELAEAHAREKRFVREQAFSEERQRIMRDMHDGLGSQLMGMLLAARRGKAEPQRVAEGLQQVIDELRLMIDSMDSVGESLGSALSDLRNRLQPRIEDAGFAFGWDNRIGNALASYPPRKTLQLFRIMQEAVANALKHSGGSRIGIALALLEDGHLQVRVEDDGRGIAGPRLGGHGLENMKARAAKEGGEVVIGAGAKGGGLVDIRFPATASADLP